jgi:hypothetical protein
MKSPSCVFQDLKNRKVRVMISNYDAGSLEQLKFITTRCLHMIIGQDREPAQFVFVNVDGKEETFDCVRDEGGKWVLLNPK